MPPQAREKLRYPRPASLACTECRRRHLKCDARLPVCSRCLEWGCNCRYLKSRRGGKRKYPIVPSDNQDIVETNNNDCHDVIISSTQQLQAESSPAAALFNLNRPWPGSIEQDTNRSVTIDTPIAISQYEGTPPPGSLYTAQEQFAASSDGAVRIPADDTLVELYYENFHRSHPILLPKIVYDEGHQYPRYLNLVIQYIGSHYSTIPTAALGTLATDELNKARDGQVSLALVQAKLLLAIAFYSNANAQEARKWLLQAIDAATGLGMNGKSFADFSYVQNGIDIKAESARRTWWELYVLDGLITAFDYRDMSNFNISVKKCDVEMPCEETVYAEGKRIPSPYSRQELESRVFGEQEGGEGILETHASGILSSFTYRIDAIDILVQVVAVRDQNNAKRDKVQAVDNTLASWAHYLPASKAEIVNAYGEIDEMLLQAHMVIQTAAILLHFPRSNLNLDGVFINRDDTDINVLYGPLSQRLPPSSTRHIHGIKATEASKRLSNLFSLCTSMQKNSPLFAFSLSLCGLVQLATFRAHARIDTSLSCLEQHRARVRLIVGLLKSSSETWPLYKVIQRRLKKTAIDTFQITKSKYSSVKLPELPSGGADEAQSVNRSTDIIFQPGAAHTWMPLPGQFDWPELAPWVWG
ncbi:hypothetical protein BGW36DRAFT_386753 [Talaromyces proteolyticus]|uniref:Zn(2)-C6 fungal-type domain-containing protein n=1 Tax=Talaromyces proteolyticus TaxID=1131652 RepID=A0AAD4PWG8_9EURO|nr:uncharacterized protein BGW36DRAFT_386753 [Talaromyces proteolyticus]KAH8691992.1 hypothetical protein BGW36DRAFT_386753 [Talaromyces proteolyticus]